MRQLELLLMLVGNILVADTNNSRIEKFSPTGTFLSTMGIKGTGYGQLGAPNGIAIDRANNIYVADASKHVVEKTDVRREYHCRVEGSFSRILRSPPDRHRPG